MLKCILTQTQLHLSLDQFEKEDVNGSKWTVTTFDITPPMPTYLVAFAVCDFDYINRTERGKEVSEKDFPGKGSHAQATASSSLILSPRDISISPSVPPISLYPGKAFVVIVKNGAQTSYCGIVEGFP